METVSALSSNSLSSSSSSEPSELYTLDVTTREGLVTDGRKPISSGLACEHFPVCKKSAHNCQLIQALLVFNKITAQVKVN